MNQSFIAGLRKKIINVIPFLSDIRNNLLVKDTIKQFEVVDFEVTRKKGKFHISFNNKLNYEVPLKSWFYFDQRKKAYHVDINGIQLYTYTFPLPEIVRELRGYLLFGPPLENATVIDIGASNGFISMVLAKMILPNGTLFAIEPDKYYRKALGHNISQNDIKNIIISNQCIYSSNGLFSFEAKGDGSAMLVHNTEKKDNQVEALTLETFFQEKNIDPKDISLIKMDIEGAEIEICDDLIKFLMVNTNALVAIASYHKIDDIYTSDIIEQKCKAYKELVVKTTYPYHRTTFLTHHTSPFAKKILNHPGL